MQAELTYFTPSGNYLTSCYYETGLTDIDKILAEVRNPKTLSNCPIGNYHVVIRLNDTFAVLHLRVNKLGRIQNHLDNLTDDERLSLLNKYCDYCGGFNPCFCWNDE